MVKEAVLALIPVSSKAQSSDYWSFFTLTLWTGGLNWCLTAPGPKGRPIITTVQHNPIYLNALQKIWRFCKLLVCEMQGEPCDLTSMHISGGNIQKYQSKVRPVAQTDGLNESLVRWKLVFDIGGFSSFPVGLSDYLLKSNVMSREAGRHGFISSSNSSL